MKTTILVSDSSEEDIAFPVADMMAVLMLIFLLIAIALMSASDEAASQAKIGETKAREAAIKLSEANSELADQNAKLDLAHQMLDEANHKLLKKEESLRQLTSNWDKERNRVYESLQQEFQPFLSIWQAEIIEKSLTFRFNEPRVLFDRDSDEITDRFKSILSEFFPRYIAVLGEFSQSISEVRVEGHTSSEWNDEVTINEAYFLNMELSQKRTLSVLNYCFGTLDDLASFNWVKQNFVASGMSSSRLIFTDNKEDRERSRRVEFRVFMRSDEKLDKILENLSAQ